MTADNDIVNIVDGKFSGRSFIHLPRGDWADLRAEIVRLRGEVEALLEDPDEAELAYRCGDPDSDAIAPAEAKGDFCPRCRGTGETCTGTIDGTPELFDCRDCLGSGLFTAPVGATIADAAGDQSLTLDAARELLRAVAHAIKLGRYNAPQPAGGEAVAPGRCAECRHTTFERRHDGSHICAHCKAVYAALRAADNRDAAGVVPAWIATWMADREILPDDDGDGISEGALVEALNNHERELLNAIPKAPAAVPAGEAVAWIKPDWQNPANYDGKSPVSTYPQAGWIPLYTTPPAPVQAAPQEGEAQRHAANEWADMAINGVQWLRNIRDGISTADEALAEMESNLLRVRALNDAARMAAHPSACELGAAGELGPLTLRRDDDGKLQLYRVGFALRFATFSPGVLESERCAVFAALQHRGDSRGGEG